MIFLYFTVQISLATGGIQPFILVMVVPFIVIFIIAAYGIWRQSRIGYIISVAITGIFFALFGSMTAQSFANPADATSFVLVITVLPLLAAALIYSITGLRSVWRKGMVPAAMPTIPKNSILALLTIGFIIGGLVVGLLAGATQSRLLSSLGTGDIVIVRGASSPGNAQFFTPPSLMVTVGHTVVWVNHDSADHTATSTTPAGAFDSQNIASGGTWSFKFASIGTYQYVCSYHSWMKGTVIVVSP